MLVVSSFPSKHQLLLWFEHFGSHIAHWLCGWGHGLFGNDEYIYRLLFTMYVAIFIAKLQYRQSSCIFAHISMTTQARSRLQIWRSSSSKVIVGNGALNFSAHYAWYCHGRSHIEYSPLLLSSALVTISFACYFD